jgi:hypothetical protein
MPTIEQDYPFIVNVDGVECRVDIRLPEGVNRGIYEIYGTPGCYRFCERCTDAARPGSTRDMCLSAQQLPPIDRIGVRPEDFVA